MLVRDPLLLRVPTVSYTFPMRMDRGCRSTSIVRKRSTTASRSGSFADRPGAFVALEAEIPQSGRLQEHLRRRHARLSSRAPMTARSQHGSNRCAHRGAMVCRSARGNATSHTCVYHQWSYNSSGTLLGVPFRRGQKGMTGMPADFDPKAHSLAQAARRELSRPGVRERSARTRQPLCLTTSASRCGHGSTASFTSRSSTSAARASIRSRTGSSISRTSRTRITRACCICSIRRSTFSASA